MRFACRNKEELQLFAYGFLDGPEAAVLESHLQGCSECREEMDRLVRERQIVAFELSLEPGVSEADPVVPVPLHAPEAPGRRLRLPRAVVPALIAAAAVVLVIAALSALLTVDPVQPDPTEWTRLPDGSRYHPVEGATVREGRRLRSITLDEGALIIDVEPDERAFTVRTPHGSVSSDGGRLEVSVSDAGTRFEVADGQAHFTPSDRPRELRIEGAADEDWGVLRDWNAMLMAYVLELEAELARARAEAELLAGVGSTPEETVSDFDFVALADDMRVLSPYIAAGKLPRDPAMLRRLIEHQRRLRTLADALGLEGASLAEIVRDPRSGPRLFSSVVAQAWPQASDNDLLQLEDGVARALTEYEEKTTAADTPAALAAAEEALKKDLAREVESFEEQQGPPTVEPLPKEPILREAAPVREDPVETPQNGGEIPDPPTVGSDATPAEVEPTVPSGGTGSSIGGTGQSTATDILSNAGFSSENDLVYRGPVDYLVKYVVEAWMRDYSLPRTLKADLKRLALQWVSNYRNQIRIEDPDVVAALEARLGRGTVPVGVKTSSVLALRERLLGLQAVSEKSLYELLRQENLLPAKLPATRATFFLID